MFLDKYSRGFRLIFLYNFLFESFPLLEAAKSGIPSLTTIMVMGARMRFGSFVMRATYSKNELKSVRVSLGVNQVRRSASICSIDFPSKSWMGWKVLGSS